MALPIAPQAIPYRACVRQERRPFKPSTPGRMFSIGIRQSSNTSCDVTEARRDILPLCSKDENPLVQRSTRKPRMTPSSLAQTTAMSATDPLVIQALAPFKTYEPPSFFAVVRIPPGLEPKSGSVSPKQPIAEASASLGIQ